METDITGKEEEYAEALKGDIEAERLRLGGQGYSPEKVTELVSRYKSNMERFYRDQLDSYSRRIRENQSVLLEELETEQAELRKQIAELKTERESILADYESREDTLRQEFAADTKVMEGSSDGSSPELEQARKELAELNRAKDTEGTIRNIINEVYCFLFEDSETNVAAVGKILVTFDQDPPNDITVHFITFDTNGTDVLSGENLTLALNDSVDVYNFDEIEKEDFQYAEVFGKYKLRKTIILEDKYIHPIGVILPVFPEL
jgi:hypothetical protein